MRMTSAAGRYQFSNSMWCFLPNLPPFGRLEYFDRLMKPAEAAMEALRERTPDLPQDFELGIAQCFRGEAYGWNVGGSFRPAALARARSLADRYATTRRLVEGGFNSDALANCAAEATSGEHGSLRTQYVKMQRGGPKNGIVCPPPSHCRDLLEEWVHAANRQGARGSLAWAAMSYAHILFIHPFADGNGRLARAVAAAVWQYGDEKRFPLLLTPVLKIIHFELTAWLIELMTSGNWSRFLARFRALVLAYAEISGSLLAKQPRTYPGFGVC